MNGLMSDENICIILEITPIDEEALCRLRLLYFQKVRGTLPDKYEDKSKSKGYVVYKLARSSSLKFQTSPR